MDVDWNRSPHRRYNPLTGTWILVSPQRTDRPWQGETEKTSAPAAPAYDPHCYLCPGNERARGVRNPPYTSLFVFDNDFPALLPETPHAHFDTKGLLSAETERGICRVLCFTPRHDLSISGMTVEAIKTVVDGWRDQYNELGALSFINNVQIFENHGAMMGASNPHPHCQIWANASVPDEVAKETASQLEYDRSHGGCLLCEYVALERGGERLIYENENFMVLVPFWAVWPFETLVVGKRHATGLDELSDAERVDLAAALRQITTTYDNIFHSSFPYTMGIHQRPTDGRPHRSWHMHAHYYPPLLRSASVRKFMVGYEMLASAQRDITAEMAAARLREASREASVSDRCED